MARSSAIVAMLMLAGSASAEDRLEVIDLPVGFAPEGITIGRPWEAYVGSLVGEKKLQRCHCRLCVADCILYTAKTLSVF